MVVDFTVDRERGVDAWVDPTGDRGKPQKKRGKLDVGGQRLGQAIMIQGKSTSVSR